MISENCIYGYNTDYFYVEKIKPATLGCCRFI